MNEEEAVRNLLESGRLQAEYQIHSENGNVIAQCADSNVDTVVGVLLKFDPGRKLTIRRRLILTGDWHMIDED